MRYLLLLLSLIVLSSCGENRIYEQEYEIEDGKWSYSDSLEYKFQIKDTSKIYGLGITVEFNQDYPYENVYTNIKTFLPNDEVRENIFSVELQKPSKRRSLKCKKGECIVDVFLQAPLKFIDEGEYALHIFQHTRDEELPGVNKIGLYLVELKSEFKE